MGTTAVVMGFKEWQVVCDALASGRQSFLLRKGGIHEGRAGFSFAHREFFLFPTRFHAQASQVREGKVQEMPEWQVGETLSLTHYIEAQWAVTLTDWEQVKRLEPYHIYSEETVRDRFDWEGKGMHAGSIHVAFVKVKTLEQAWEIPYVKAYGGCRSWIQLPEPPSGWLERAREVIPEHRLDGLEASLPH